MQLLPTVHGDDARRTCLIAARRTDRGLLFSPPGPLPDVAQAIESNANEAIESGFPEQLKDGRLEWRSVNYEEPGNEHYATDYKIAAPCLVLVRMKSGKAVEWRSLPEVWELVSDKPAFVQLVQRNVQEFLDYIAIPGACCT